VITRNNVGMGVGSVILQVIDPVKAKYESRTWLRIDQLTRTIFAI